MERISGAAAAAGRSEQRGRSMRQREPAAAAPAGCCKARGRAPPGGTAACRAAARRRAAQPRIPPSGGPQPLTCAHNGGARLGAGRAGRGEQPGAGSEGAGLRQGAGRRQAARHMCAERIAGGGAVPHRAGADRRLLHARHAADGLRHGCHRLGGAPADRTGRERAGCTVTGGSLAGREPCMAAESAAAASPWARSRLHRPLQTLFGSPEGRPSVPAASGATPPPPQQQQRRSHGDGLHRGAGSAW